ncbi:hypothetical protein AMTR_s00040p00219400 [Amborella trichopoda]|uniref:RFTS domain-containing protein n=1 Tax=Amborella trichopoda TaxID=13333 RepID=W1PYP8_AMBTC|nr:hypothetical protein AMTR_s00040p00219400 [Amborella trichopoda]
MEELDPELLVEIKDEIKVIQVTRHGLYEGRPLRRLTSFSITNSVDERVMIDHSTLESLFISELADYLCERPSASYVNCYSSFKFKASLCIQTFYKLTVDRELEFGELLLSLVSAMLEDWPGSADSNLMSETLKPHMAFVADQLVALDQKFSKLKAMNTIYEVLKEDMEKIRMLRQENMMNGRKFSGSFYSIHHCNEEFDKEASKENDGEKVKMEASSSQPSLEEEKRHPPNRRSLATYIENQEKNIETVKKAAMDTRKIDEGIEVVNGELVVSMTGTTDIEILRAQRSLKGFKMLDEGEALQPFENLEHGLLYITSEIWPSYNSEEPNQGVLCNSFGPAVSWCITGYEEGTPEIWVSTDLVDYLCRKPSADYLPFFKPFYEKAMLCIRAFQIISASPYLKFDEFCRELVSDILPCFDTFKDEDTTWNYVNSHLRFIAEQLIGLDWISFCEKPSIKSIIDKFKMNVAKAMDTKACGSFLSLYDKNWWIKNCRSEAMILTERDPSLVVRQPEAVKASLGRLGNKSESNEEQHTQEKPKEVKEGGGGELVPGSNVPKMRASKESSAIEMTRPDLKKPDPDMPGRPRRRLSNFEIKDSAGGFHSIDDRDVEDLFIAAQVRSFDGPISDLQLRCNYLGPIRSWCITGFREGSLAIWLSTDLADYLCLIPLPEYESFYWKFWNKASLCIWAYKKLKKKPDMDYDNLLGYLVHTLMRRIGGDYYDTVQLVKSLFGFLIDQLIGLDPSFSELKAIKSMSEEYKGQLENIREATLCRRWKLSGSFYSIQDFNEKHKQGVSSMNPHYSNKKNQNKEMGMEKVAMDQEAEVIEVELVAVSKTRPKAIEIKRAHRRLKGFMILDEKEDMRAIEDLEHNKFYISPEIGPLYGENSNTVVRRKLFGPITSWCITGYNEGCPSIWISTKVADYLCDEPNKGYTPLFKPLYVKAVLCIHAFQFLKKKPSGKFRELFKEMILALKANFENFKDNKEACNVANSHLNFIAEQLIGLDMSFSKLQAIKTMIKKSKVDITKAGNTKARFSFFSIDEQNKWLHKGGSSFSSSEKNENRQKHQLENNVEKVGEGIMKKPKSHVRALEELNMRQGEDMEMEHGKPEGGQDMYKEERNGSGT